MARHKPRRSRSRSKACRGRRKVKARWSSKRCRRASRGRKHPSRGRRVAARRNPERQLKDGTTVTLDEYGKTQGIVRVIYPDGSMRDYKSSWTAALKRFHAIKSKRGHESRARKADYAMLAADNPRRRGRGRTRRNCGMTQDPRWATTKIIRRGGGRNPKGRKIYRPRGRNAWRYNPAQFPMPFASALNPRRNAPMTQKEAHALARVMRRHGHKRCRA